MSNPLLIKFIQEHIKIRDSILDVGSGMNWVKEILSMVDILTLDICPAAKPVILWDVGKGLPFFSDRQFDVVLLLDIVEHLEKPLGRQLIGEAQRVTRREVILLTPLWWTKNREPYDDPQSIWFHRPEVLHRSFWEEEDFSDLGWERFPLPDVNEYYLGRWTR
jgi:hypothetical protein